MFVVIGVTESIAFVAGCLTSVCLCLLVGRCSVLFLPILCFWVLVDFLIAVASLLCRADFSPFPDCCSSLIR